MALSNALYTGLSGLDVNQTRMNVVGNNIANANTVAFKASRALFKTQFYITDSAGTPSSTNFGGENPSQRGLGATVATIEKDFTPGSIESTGRETDMAIDGDGFFIAQNAGQQEFTRDGSFSLNSNNQLVTTSGAFVQGFGVDVNGNVTSTLQNITVPLGASASATATTSVNLEGNLDASGTVASGASVLNSQLLTTWSGGTATAPPTGTTLLTDLASTTTPGTQLVQAGDTLTLNGTKGGKTQPAKTFTVTSASTVSDLETFFNDELGIDTAVTPPTGAPTPGSSIYTDTTGDPSGNSIRLSIAGNVGTDNSLAISGTGLVNQSNLAPFSFADGQDGAGVASDPTGESVNTAFVAYDSLGTPLTVNVTAVLEGTSNTGNTWRFYATSGDSTNPSTDLGTGTLTFDADGKLTGSTGTTLNIDRANTGARTPLNVSLDFSSMTSLTSQSSNMVMTKQDGTPIGTLTAFSFGTDGTITGSYTNGLTKTLGRVALATFNNPLGLDDQGGGFYKAGADSGLPIITSPTSLGTGAIRSGSLEESNVDLAKEFTNMIIASTGFSASSRVITTSDQMLNELLNSSR